MSFFRHGTLLFISLIWIFLLAAFALWPLSDSSSEFDPAGKKTGLEIKPGISRKGPSRGNPAEGFPNGGGRVVLVTLDGVRPREFFGKPERKKLTPESRLNPDEPVFRIFWAKHASAGLILGRPGSRERFWLANPVMYSLPAYQGIFAGLPGFCFSNRCGRASALTFPERFLKEKGLERREAAVFASWEKIKFAVERGEGTLTVNAGLNPFAGGDPAHERLNREQEENNPTGWTGARLDRYTFAHALRYLRINKPRFLFISLNDSDEWAHLDDYDRYLATLRQYDEWLEKLIAELDALDPRATLIVTTDHGRGREERFRNHGLTLRAAPVWLYARGPFVKIGGNIAREEGRSFFTHLDIRPTVEKLLGLSPRRCAACGRAIKSIAGP